MNAKLKAIVTDFVTALKSGVEGKWQKSWNAKSGLPVSISTGEAYKGINTLILLSQGFASPIWGTFKAYKEKGAHVRKGEKGTNIVLYRPYENDDGSTGVYRTTFVVFNSEQTTWDAPVAEQINDTQRWQHCENIIKGTNAVINHGGNTACYIPSRDSINLPHFADFDTTADYYATAFHELAHWTGHSSRLDRNLSGRFGSHSYALEELVAELSAAFMAASLGFESVTRDSHIKYLKGWIDAINEHPEALFRAAAAAQKAVDYIMSPPNDLE